MKNLIVILSIAFLSTCILSCSPKAATTDSKFTRDATYNANTGKLPNGMKTKEGSGGIKAATPNSN